MDNLDPHCAPIWTWWRGRSGEQEAQSTATTSPATQLNNSCPSAWSSAWDTSPSAPRPVSRRGAASDIGDKDNRSCPAASPEHHREEESSLTHLLYAICAGWEDQELPRRVSAKKKGAKQVHRSPVRRRAVLASLGLKAQGKSWCCDPLLNRWMVTRWNRLSGETVQFPTPEVSEVSSSPIAQWIYNASFREWVKTLPQLSKQHAKDKLLFLHLFPLSRRENKTRGGNGERKEECSAFPHSSILSRLQSFVRVYSYSEKNVCENIIFLFFPLTLLISSSQQKIKFNFKNPLEKKCM